MRRLYDANPKSGIYWNIIAQGARKEKRQCVASAQKEGPGQTAGSLCFRCLQKRFLALRVEEVNQIMPEGEIEGIPPMQAIWPFFQKLQRGNPHNHVLTPCTHMEVDFTAHHFGYIHLRGDGVRPRLRLQLNVLGTDTDAYRHRSDASGV